MGVFSEVWVFWGVFVVVWGGFGCFGVFWGDSMDREPWNFFACL